MAELEPDDDGRRQWVAGFDLPDDQWLVLDVHALDGPEQVAARIAERAGEAAAEDAREAAERYAEAAYEELRAIAESAADLHAAPVAVCVPADRPEFPPMVPATAYTARHEPPDGGRSPAAIAAVLRGPREYRMTPPDIRETELPLGPACRVRELARHGAGPDGRPVLMEYLSFYVLPDSFPGGVLQFTVTWAAPGRGPEWEKIAEEMALTLGVRPAEGG
ncbi:hypothetical protein [Streptomyces aidingensis]|uniref:Uncharacterized protein n=1 Tax=Streptomyces aidingensis TaxID=910347 RepID=A0A1I1R4H5_9ACTN|nr:hypothetical protein [Streptomyces aidingensis]SFD29199.1 hypothetical protein SAMN05421773_112175 [Streptomyces aidingensis]